MRGELGVLAGLQWRPNRRLLKGGTACQRSGPLTEETMPPWD
jgi:hypothetical protein